MVSRKSSVTAESLEVYRDLLKTATDDLDAHLQSIDEKLETIFARTLPESASDAAELQLINEERLSAQQCLQICAQLSEHIDQIQLPPKRSGNSPGPKDSESLPERFTTEGLQECKTSLKLTATKLERLMKDRIDRLVTKSKSAMTSEEDLMDLARLQEEWEMAHQCVDLYSKAEIHLKESVSTIENYATGDAIQLMVSTDGKIIHGINRGLGWRSRQVGGHLNDATVQQISRDMSSMGFHNIGSVGQPSQGNQSSIPNNEVENQSGSEFRERYGRGFKLPPKTTADTPMSSSTLPTEGGQSSSPKR